MFILHAALEDDSLHLWAEKPLDAPLPASTRKAAPEPRPYPFDAGSLRIAAALMELLPGQSIPNHGGSSPFVWLPTSKNRPIPSSGLIADIPAEDVKLHPWTITTLPVPESQWLDLLCACVHRDRLGQGVLIGQTLAFWAKAFRQVGALVAREQIVPGLRKDKDSWRAVWQPVMVGPEAKRFAQLTKLMPPACRALSRSAEAPPDTPAIEVLAHFFERICNLLVRNNPDANALRKSGRLAVARGSSVHDEWLFALTERPDGKLNAEEKEIAALAEQVRSWQRPLRATSQQAFQLCFRLEEPTEESDQWRMQYLLQAHDDQSLLLPLNQVWKAPEEVRSLFEKVRFDPREYLLTALGQAATMSQAIEASLQQPSPTGFSLDLNNAFLFLSQSAWMLEQAGFVVMLPSWWTTKGSKNRLKAQAEIRSPKLNAKSGLDLASIVKFQWKIALDDEELTLEELLELAKLKVPLVNLRGRWVQIDAAELKAAIELLKKQATGQATVRQIVQMSLGGASGLGNLPFQGVKADGWIGELLDQLQGKIAFTELPLPAGFTGTLRPYQQRGWSWLAFLRQCGFGSCLADDMGLGKTVQTLTLLQHEWPVTQKPTLLVCPTSVVTNWQKEAQKFTPSLPVMIHHGHTRQKKSAFAKAAQKQALVLTSYSLLHRDRESFEGVKWGGIILDEAQNIKNAETKQSQAARSLEADFRIALTGTPVENHVGDLWSIFEFLNPGWLGSQADFRKRYLVPIQAGQGAEVAERLKKLTTPFLLRRVKTDKTIISDLPDKVESKVFCKLTKEQGTLYQAVVDDLTKELGEIDGIKRKGMVLATLTKLKQVCNHPAHFLGDNTEVGERSGKVNRLLEMLEEIDETGEKVLIFSQYTEMCELLKRHLQETFGREVLLLHGGIKRELRTRMIERFQAEPTSQADPRIFLLTVKAGGTGLNLTAATHVFHFDRWWNPAVENQATDRAYRIGQKQSVQVHKFVCSGTVEERIDEMIERKMSVAAKVVGNGEDWLTELSNEQLQELFTLSKDAIGE